MRTFAFVLTCLACAGHSRRVQQSTKADEAAPSSENALAAFLLGSNPAASFNPSTPGARSPAEKSSSISSASPAVSRSSAVTGQDAAEANAGSQYMSDYKEARSNYAERGFGLTVRAERWNGRHAMFGWLVFAMTAYAKTHGFFPDADMVLKSTDWGSLTRLGFGGTISNERAIIMVLHMHALGVSFCAALGPTVLGDTLFLAPGEADEEPYGMFPPFWGQAGLTPAAEMWNGRMAMVGIIAVILSSFVSGKEILEVIDIGTGGLFLSGKDLFR